MQNSQYEESMRRMYEARQKEYQRMVYEAIYSPSQNQNQVGDGSASGSGGGGNPNSVELTPFILQAWAFGETTDWGLYRLKSDGTLVAVENAPPLEGPAVFAKNNINGLHYYMTISADTGLTNFGMWDSVTGEWQFLVESGEVLRHLTPASLQYVEGNDDYPSYFIYTDNNLYAGPGGEVTAPKTFRIDLDTPTSFELTELYEWEIPAENYDSFPISTFYKLPVAIGESPSQGLFQVQQYGASFDAFPLSTLYSIDGDTYEKTYIDQITINDMSIFAVKVAFVLDRTDYEGDIYFNILANDKINETQIYYIAKFDPNSEDPSNLTSIYQYSWDYAPYLTLTTI